MRKKTVLIFLFALLFSGTTFAQTNAGGKSKTAYMVADAHLDTQWNWDIQTTISDYVAKTLRQNLFLFEKYPDYKFNFEGAVKYSWMKEYYPIQYQLVKKYIDQGRWHLAGSSWDANETIICSPESFLRNILLGQTFYRQEFNKEGTDIFLPDCFGFTYTLPTLASHSGLIGFSTQKLGWRSHPFYSGNRKYPFPVGLWEGIDGSRIMMVHGFGYGERFKDEDLSHSKLLSRELQESPIGVIYRYYGTGDTGGSPDIPSVRSLEKGIKGDGPIKIISATSDQIYKDFLPYENHPELPIAKGEMTMDVHGTGCYTSQAAMKLYNRQNELLGDAAERSSVFAEWLGTRVYPSREMTQNWQRVILHQFHDDLPGTCIPRAYEFSWNDELLSLNRYSHVLTSSVSGIASQMNTKVSGTPVVLYNNESFPVQSVARITLPDMANSYTVKDASGKKVASQVITDSKGDRHLLVEANLPGTSVSVYSVKVGGRNNPSVGQRSSTMENSIYKLQFDGNGNLSSIYDKLNQKELVGNGQSVGLVVFDDCRSYNWPAWEVLKHTLDKEPVIVKDNVQMKLMENGPVRKTMCISRTYGKSKIDQYVSLYEGSLANRIDFYNEVDWNSTNSMLKAQFPLSISNEKATYDLGLGSVKRGNNRDNSYEVYSQKWTDLTDEGGSYGVTILNDSKYGWDKPNSNTLRLSLLFTPKTDRSYTYQDHQDLGYHTFTYSLIGHKGQLDQAKAVEQSTILNSPIRAFASAKHSGKLGKEFSFLSSNNPNVTVRALKKAEVGNDYIVRVYENAGQQVQNAQLTFAGNIINAVEADGTEQEIGKASYAGNKLNVEIKPYSVKTYKVVLDNQPKTATPYEPIVLPYDRKCFSFNGFRNQANFEGGYSYAAELLPDDGLTVDNVPFLFGAKDAANGVTCKGNSIKLPSNDYNRVYLLAASTKGDRDVEFKVGRQTAKVSVPYYTGFHGQWGHNGHTRGYVKDAEVAYIGTHRHSPSKDEPYEFTYMYKIGLDIPKGAQQITLPNDDRVVVFAATAVKEGNLVCPAGDLYRTNNKSGNLKELQVRRPNLLAGSAVIARSGEVSTTEKAENLIDGNEETKWCDTGAAPMFVDFDMGESKQVKGWRIVNAGVEADYYITKTCLLQGRNQLNEEWKTLDILSDNNKNEVTRSIAPAQVRYVRLYVISPEQGKSGNAARIYELELY